MGSVISRQSIVEPSGDCVTIRAFTPPDSVHLKQPKIAQEPFLCFIKLFKRYEKERLCFVGFEDRRSLNSLSFGKDKNIDIELFCHICLYIQNVQDYCSMNLVSKDWKIAISETKIWKVLIQGMEQYKPLSVTPLFSTDDINLGIHYIQTCRDVYILKRLYYRMVKKWRNGPDYYDFEKQKFNILLIGSNSVGKTSFIHRLKHNEFDAHIQSTIGVHDTRISFQRNTKTDHCVIWDCSGQQRFQFILRSYIKDANLIVLMFDLSRSETFEELCNLEKGRLHEFLQLKPDSCFAVMIGMKSDLKSDNSISYRALNFCIENGIPYFECSSKESESSQNALDMIAFYASSKRL